MLTALIVEDDEMSARALETLLKGEGFVPFTVSTLAAARRRMAEQPPSLALVDMVLPDGNGLDLCKTLGECAPEASFVLITGFASVETAVEALRSGVSDYLTKPIDLGRLKLVFAHLRRERELNEEIGALRSELLGLGRFEGMIGASTGMQRIFELIRKVAPTQASVLILGESGTGKELVAEAIHRLSKRRNQPFIAVNCGAISPHLIESELFGHERGSFTGAEKLHRGYFERASGGTLFFDEVSEMPPDLQVKLLRVLESGLVVRVGGDRPVAVDLRVIAASNRDLDQAVAEGKFRQDLLYRLKVFPIALPPLRERSEDIDAIAESFLAEHNRREGRQQRFAAAALAALRACSWPGNVRELKNVVSRAAILAGDEVGVGDLPAELQGGRWPEEPGGALRFAPGTPVAVVQRRLVLATLESLDGDRAGTADALGISIRTLYNWLKEYQAEGGWGEGSGESVAPPGDSAN